MSNHWMVSGGFAWNSSRILYQGTTANAAPNNPLQAYDNAANLSYWGANFRGSYQAPLGMVVSPTFRAIQGQPIDRLMSLTGLHVGSYNLIVDPYEHTATTTFTWSTPASRSGSNSRRNITSGCSSTSTTSPTGTG